MKKIGIGSEAGKDGGKRDKRLKKTKWEKKKTKSTRRGKINIKVRISTFEP